MHIVGLSLNKMRDTDFEFNYIALLTFWRRNYFINFSTPCILNVNNTGTKYVRFRKQTAF